MELHLFWTNSSTLFLPWSVLGLWSSLPLHITHCRHYWQHPDTWQWSTAYICVSVNTNVHTSQTLGKHDSLKSCHFQQISGWITAYLANITLNLNLYFFLTDSTVSNILQLPSVDVSKAPAAMISAQFTEHCWQAIFRWTLPMQTETIEVLWDVLVQIQSLQSTVETLYSTIYYSKYLIELNFDKSTQYVALWTHKRHPIPRPFGRAMECLLWVLQQKLTVL